MFENWCRSVILLGVTILFVKCDGVSKPIRTFDKHEASRNLHLRKRQINQEQFPPQFFPFLANPTQPSNEEELFDQFRGPPRSRDEEERFFALQEQRATTLNPLAFINPPRTTLSPLERQLLEEQQRFQQEIADQGLREQQQLSLGVPRPPTPRPSPNVNSAAPVQFQESPPAQSQPTFPPNPSPVSNNLRQLDPPQSFAFVRTYHPTEQRRKRAIDHRQSLANRLVVSPTRTYLGTLLQQPEPRRDIVTISNWLVKQLAKQIQKNIDHLTESTPTNAAFVSTTTLPPHYATSQPEINLVTDVYSETANAKQWGNSISPTTRDIAGTTTQTPTTPSPYVVPHGEAIMISQEVPSVPAAYATLVTPSSNVIYQPNVRSIPNVRPVLYSPRQLQQQYADISKSAELPQFIGNDGIVYRVQPTVASVNPIASDETRSTRMQNVQVLGTVSTPSSTVDQQNLYLPRNYQGSAFGGLRQVYNFDHPRDADIESNLISTSDRSNLAQRGTTVTSLFKTKLLNDYKNVDSYLQKDETERNRLAFQQPNRFFDLLQQSNSTSEVPFVNNESFSFDSAKGVNGSKAAIFIRVPDEEQTSTRGYIFDKAIIAKSPNKKDYGSHKKYNRSPQVIKSSLVYRTPPGKKAATANRSEFAQSNLIPDDRAVTSNYLINGTPILGFLRGNKRSTTTNRPFVTALFDYIQKRNVKKNE